VSHILALLQEMRRRPGMYIGKPSVIRLAAYLRGYELAAERLGGQEADDFLPEFRDWIHERFGSTEYSWEETILQHSTDNAAAQEMLWVLLDEFLAKRGATASAGTAGATSPFPPVGPVTNAPMTKNS
jgi:hypothetical protein